MISLVTLIWPVGQAVKTLASHAENMGSIPVRVTKKRKQDKCPAFSFFVPRPSSNTARTRTACVVLWVRTPASPFPVGSLQGEADSRTSPHYVHTIFFLTSYRVTPCTRYFFFTFCHAVSSGAHASVLIGWLWMKKYGIINSLINKNLTKTINVNARCGIAYGRV